MHLLRVALHKSAPSWHSHQASVETCLQNYFDFNFETCTEDPMLKA